MASRPSLPATTTEGFPQPWPALDDPCRPKDEEYEILAKMEAAVRAVPELSEEFDKCYDRGAMLIAFFRGYYNNQFKDEPDPSKRLALTTKVLKRTLMWRKAGNVSQLASRELPKRPLFDSLWGSWISGYTLEGRPVYVYHMPDPEMDKSLSKSEVAWLHWQEYEWLLKKKAEHSKKHGTLLLDQVIIVDFGDNKSFKAHGINLGGIKWFQSAIKWEPEDLEKGEKPMDVDSYCYPESLNKLYCVNTNIFMLGLWKAVKPFIYPTTAAKFTLLSYDQQSNFQKMVESGIPQNAIPAYLGGEGFNPPGLLLTQDVKKGTSIEMKIQVPPNHEIIYRFRETKGASGATVTLVLEKGDNQAEEKTLTLNGEFSSGTFPASREFATIKVTFAAAAQTAKIDHEVQCKELQDSLPTQAPATSSSNSETDQDHFAQDLAASKKATAIHPALWRTKKSGFRQSVFNIDTTELPSQEGVLSKYGNWATGFQERYFVVNNEYLNYYHATTKPTEAQNPDGSYSLKKLTRVTSNKCLIEVVFDDDGVERSRQLKADSDALARKWAEVLESRRQFFTDFSCAAEVTERRNSKATEQAIKKSEESKLQKSSSRDSFESQGSSEKSKSDKQQIKFAVVAVLFMLIGIAVGWYVK